MPRNKANHIYPATEYSNTASTIDAAQYIITLIDDDAFITEEQLHQLLFVAQTILLRDVNAVFTADTFINAGSTPQAVPLAEVLAPIKPEALSNSDTELRFDNESYIGGIITKINKPERMWLQYVVDCYFDNMPAWRLGEICAKSPILNRVASGETIDFNPAG
jgi:hypothetical protein